MPPNVNSADTGQPSPSQVAPAIWAIALPMPGSFMRAVNVYIIRDADGLVLVDCGLQLPETWDALSQQLAQLGYTPADIHTIMATHGHLDHYGLAAQLRAASGASIWLHGTELAYLRQRYLEHARDRERLEAWLVRHGFPPSEAAASARAFEERASQTTFLPPDRLLHGEEILQVGGYRFEVLWTPGHTPGHSCLFDRAQRLILSGDHILEHVAPNVSLQPFSEDNPLVDYLTSLDHFQQLDIALALPGHGRPMTNLASRARQLREHQLARRADVQQRLSRQPQTAYHLAAQLWADSRPTSWQQFSPFLRRNAVGAIAAHLELLVQQGLATRHVDQTAGYCRA